MVATGAYSAWVETGTILPAGTEYWSTLIIKSTVVLGTLVVGGLNYLDGGRMRRWLDGFPTRLKIEAGLAATVLAVTRRAGHDAAGRGRRWASRSSRCPTRSARSRPA